jgi:two-component system chemotaxis response regulator CheY
MKTLIVEDDMSSRFILQRFLAGYGECFVAVNGKEAVEAFRLAREEAKPFDLICMDIMMPEMDGQEALQQIRDLEENADVPSNQAVKIFMTTALQDTKNVMTAFRSLCDAYLFKPIDKTQLLENLRKFELIP